MPLNQGTPGGSPTPGGDATLPKGECAAPPRHVPPARTRRPGR